MSAPKHFGQRHFDHASDRQGRENLFGFLERVRLEHDVSVVARVQFESHRFWRVGAHQDVTTEDWQLHVHDQVLVGLGDGMVRVARHVAHASDWCAEFGAENAFVKVEGGFGVAFKIEVRADSRHDCDYDPKFCMSGDCAPERLHCTHESRADDRSIA